MQVAVKLYRRTYFLECLLMYTENQYSLHMVNIDYIDSLGYVTYFDKQQGSIGYNNATDYSVFYTKE